MRRVLIALAIVTMVVAATFFWMGGFEIFTEESFTAVESNPADLIARFKSYASFARVKEHMLDELEWKVSPGSALPLGGSRPPYHILVVTVPSFEDLGHKGELSLSFFNDRLTSTIFYPSDPQLYIAALRRSGILKPDSDEATIGRFTSVWTGTDYHGRKYVAWADQRLLDQQDRWISRYS